MDTPRVCENWRWGEVDVRYLKIMRRCKCEVLKKKLQLLRMATPDRKQLEYILKTHRVPTLPHRKHRTLQPTHRMLTLLPNPSLLLP